MSYATECYLDYLDTKPIYEQLFLEMTSTYKELLEAPATALAGLTWGAVKKKMAANQDVIQKLVAHKEKWTAQGGDMAKMVIPKIDAKIAAAQKTQSGLENALATAPKSALDTAAQTAGDVGKWGKEKAAQGVEKAKQADAWAKEKLAGSETGEKVLGGLEKAAGKTGKVTTTPGTVDAPMSTAVDGGAGVAGAVQKGLHNVGVDPAAATSAGQTAGAVVGSPLGAAALGGVAAFGGYKLYKRFMSKSARACRGYSGGQKTACMKSYMDAKRGQTQSRGVEAVGQGGIAGAS